MKTRILLLALALTTAMNAVAKDNGIRTEARTSGSYHAIVIKGDLDIKIVQGNTPGIMVEGTDFQLLNTVTMLKDDTLYVYQTNVKRSMKRTFLTINIDNISLLEVKGNSNVDCTGLINADFLTLRALDGAQIKIDVRALKVDSKATGSSTINISGITAANSENVESGGVIDTQRLEVIDKHNPHELCYGC